MKLTRKHRREPPESIIPLIDVVFFLLIFFMLIGRMDATAPFSVIPAIAQTGSDMPGGGTTISISAIGKLALDGTAIEEPALITSLKADPKPLVRINVHKDAELRHFLPMVAEIEKLGGRDIVLVVTPEIR